MLTPDVRFMPRLSGSLARMLSARSATHCINCCKLCRVDASTVNSFTSSPNRRRSMSAGTDSDNTTAKINRNIVNTPNDFKQCFRNKKNKNQYALAKFSAGPLSWLDKTDGRNKHLNPIKIECNIKKLVKSLALCEPVADNRYKFIFIAKKFT